MISAHPFSRTKNLLHGIGLVVIAAVTLLACLSKLVSYDSLYDALAATEILPRPSLKFVAPAIVLVELFCFFGILLHKLRPLSLLSMAGFYGGAAIYSLLRLQQGITAECGCFPGVLRLSPIESVFLTLLLFAISLSCYLSLPSAKTEKKVDKWEHLKSTGIIGLCLIFVALSIFKIFSTHPAFAVPGIVELDEIQTANLRVSAHDRSTDPKILLFTDFECPGCHQVNADLAKLKHEIPTLVVEVHHLPLTQIHPLAMTKALVFEGCRAGGFDDKVGILLRPDPPTAADWESATTVLTHNERYSNLWAIAQNIVAKDMEAGRKLELRTTPSLFLSAHGHFFFVQDISQISDLVRNFVKANTS